MFSKLFIACGVEPFQQVDDRLDVSVAVTVDLLELSVVFSLVFALVGEGTVGICFEEDSVAERVGIIFIGVLQKESSGGGLVVKRKRCEAGLLRDLAGFCGQGQRHCFVDHGGAGA